MKIYSTKRIYGASDDFESDDFESTDSIVDQIDEVSDQLDEMQEDIDAIQQEDPNIMVENNIDNHYIAECDACHGIFISSMTESDQEVDKITGICPLCEKETDQYLNWVVKAVDHEKGTF